LFSSGTVLFPNSKEAKRSCIVRALPSLAMGVFPVLA
jgi:hypothetical protein